MEIAISIKQGEEFEHYDYYDNEEKAIEALQELSLKTQVLSFIQDFKEIDAITIEKMFLHDYSYWFAEILKQRFDGIIYYFPVQDCFATLIGTTYYDIQGVKPINKMEDFYTWEYYKTSAPLDAARVNIDLIKKER